MTTETAQNNNTQQNKPRQQEENLASPSIEKGPKTQVETSDGQKGHGAIMRGAIVEHGPANYKNDPKNDQSYFLELKQLNGENVKIWGKGVPEAIPKDSKSGDYIGVQRGEREPVSVQVTSKDEQGNETTKTIETMRQRWLNVSVDHSKDKKDYENTQKSKDTQDTLSKQSNTKTSNEKLAYSKEEIEEEEKRFPSLERVIPGMDIQNRYLVRAEKSKNSYAHRGKPDITLVEDRGPDIKAREVTPESIELIVKLAKQKNWDTIKVSGSTDFKRQLWMEASKEGIEVKGYTPSKEELKALEKYMHGNKNQENIIRPILSNAKNYAETKHELKDPENAERFKKAVEEKTNDTLSNKGVPSLNENSKQYDKQEETKPIKEKHKDKDISR
jgi:hypothetical protein